MRGKASVCATASCVNGITPAYAGKSFSVLPVAVLIEDHPRLCGEKFLFQQFHPLEMGSPPPMRGKGNCQPIISILIRITPAYAGKR